MKCIEIKRPPDSTHFFNGDFYKKNSFNGNFFVYRVNEHYEGWVPANLKSHENPIELRGSC